MGESAAHGAGFLDHGQKTVFPPGYPAVLAFLLKVGFAHPWVIVSLNLVFLALGLFAAYHLLLREFFADKSVVLIICSLFLLSYVVIKHFTIPLSDVPFFCCCTCSLAVMSRATRVGSPLRFLALWETAWMLAMAAITVRRIGLALLPPLVFMAIVSPHLRLPLERRSRRARLIAFAVSAFLFIGTVLIVRKTSTLSDFVGAARQENMTALVFRILRYRLSELGELLTNLPVFRLPLRLHFAMTLVGFVLFLFVLIGLATTRRRIGPTEVFMIGYLAVLFTWPFNDARFWLPVIPLVVTYSILAIERLKIPKTAITLYCLVFGLLGLTALAYTTEISFAGSTFPERYGDGNLRQTYCVAFRSCRERADLEKADPKVLTLLEEYK
jgi:hypothetical protein